MAEEQAAQAPPALSEALVAAIQADAAITYNLWKTESTEEQKAKGLEHLEKMTNDEAYRNERMTMYTGFFAQADANNDGVLDAAEYETVVRLGNEYGVSDGQWVDTRPDKAAIMYGLVN